MAFHKAASLGPVWGALGSNFPSGLRYTASDYSEQHQNRCCCYLHLANDTLMKAIEKSAANLNVNWTSNGVSSHGI